MMRHLFPKITFGIALGLAISCSSQSHIISVTENLVKGKRVIVFVPGLFGSALAEVESGDRIFQTLGQALWGKIPLAMEGKRYGIPDSLDLKADGILSGVSVVPGLYTVDGYGGSVKFLETVFGDKNVIIPFSYDWRQEDSKSAQELAVLISDLKEKGATKIALVGHSLGANLIAYYLRYGASSVEKAHENWAGTENVDVAVMASMPFRGAMNAFRDLMRGTSVGLSKTPLNATSLGSFPSYYEFLPPSSSEMYFNASLKPMGEEIFEMENWRHWQGGLFESTRSISPSAFEERCKSTKVHLALGNTFSGLMRAPTSGVPKRKVAALFILGKGKSTPARAVWTGNSAKAKGAQWAFSAEEWDSPLKSEIRFSEEGDGLVSIASQTPPEALLSALDYRITQFDMYHRGVYTRSDVQKEVSAYLKEQGF